MNHNLYEFYIKTLKGFLLRILANRTSESHHIKAAAKMIAAIINKNDGNEKDGKIWNGILDFYKSRGQKEENVILTVWVTKVCPLYLNDSIS